MSIGSSLEEEFTRLIHFRGRLYLAVNQVNSCHNCVSDP